MASNTSTIIVTQARTGSSRLPGKILKTIGGDELLKIHINQLKKSRLKDHIIVATTIQEEDKIISHLCKKWNISHFAGSEDDVLDRFYQACQNYSPKWVVRVTSDCPLLDYRIIDGVIAMAQINDLDYCSNTLIENFPDGQDVEVFKFDALTKAWNEAILNSDREHVTPYIRKNSSINGGQLFTSMNFPCFNNFNSIRMTVDEQKDFDLIEKLINKLGTNESWLAYTNYIINNELTSINNNIVRNEGYLKSIKNDTNE